MCDHNALKRDPAAWAALEWVGVQPAYDGLGTVLHMRNCTCGSTLCKTVRRAWTEDEIKQRAAARMETP